MSLRQTLKNGLLRAGGQVKNHPFAVGGVGTLLLIGLVYYFRPIFQPIIYRMMYSPTFIVTVLMTFGAIGYVVYKVSPEEEQEDDDTFNSRNRNRGIISRRTKIAIGVFIGIILVTGVATGYATELSLSDRTMENAQQIEEFPESNALSPRVVPRQVSDTQTRGSVSYRQYHLGVSDISRLPDGRLSWGYSVDPSGLRNSIYENQQGVLMADMTRTENKTIVTYNESFAIGQGMFLQRGADWNLRKGDFFALYRDDPVEFAHNGTPYAYYPKEEFNWKLTPIPHRVPVWKGGALISPNGTIEHMTPEEAQNDPRLEGQRKFPISLTRAEQESLKYRNGIINTFPEIGAHEDETEVAGLPDTGNDQPFVMDLAGETTSYVTAREPYGADTRGLDEVWFMNSYTGDRRYYASGGQTLFGPERALGVARSEDSQTGWGENFRTIEPVPVTIGDDLWWHIKVVPTDYTDVSRSVFVNAHNQNVISLQNTDRIIRLIDSGSVERESPSGGNGTISQEYWIVVYENGEEVDRIRVQDGQEFHVETEYQNQNSTEMNTTNSVAVSGIAR